MSEIRESINEVKVEGILSENGLVIGTYSKDNVEKEVIRGEIKVKVVQEINGKETPLEVSVNYFVPKITSKGKPSQAYTSLLEAYNKMKSIASVGEEEATRVSIPKARLVMNEFYDKRGELVSQPRINGSFCNIIDKAKCKPEATFKVSMYVGKDCKDEVDAEGELTGRYLLKGAIAQWGGRLDIVPFVVANPNAIDYIKDNWAPNQTVNATGRLNFGVISEDVAVQSDFGETLIEPRTRQVRELIITGGSNPMDGDFAMNPEAIQEALKERTARLEELKKKAAEKEPEVKGNYSNLGF